MQMSGGGALGTSTKGVRGEVSGDYGKRSI